MGTDELHDEMLAAFLAIEAQDAHVLMRREVKAREQIPFIAMSVAVRRGMTGATGVPEKREPNGRLTRKAPEKKKRKQSAFDKAQDETIAVARDARQRLFGLSKDDARSQDGGTFIGRLCVQGRGGNGVEGITASQYEALCRWEELAAQHRGVVAAPRGDGAFDPNKVSGRGSGVGNGYAAKVEEDYRNAHEAIQTAQNELRGRGVLFAALYECVERDREFFHLVGDLRHAANALIRHFKIGDRERGGP